MSDPFKTFGPPELCTWRDGAGFCRFQTTSPHFARKLSQRGAGLVGWSVGKSYLRIFVLEIEPWRARKLVARYLKATNGVFSEAESLRKPLKGAGKVIDAAASKKRVPDELATEDPPTFSLLQSSQRARNGNARHLRLGAITKNKAAYITPIVTHAAMKFFN